MQREIIDPFKNNQRNIWDWESIKQTSFMEGVKQKAVEMALIGIKEGFDNKLIKELTDLSEEKINELRKNKS